MEYTVKQIASMIDHTNLKAYATREDFVLLCGEARKYGFKSVAVNACQVPLCRELLEGSGVLIAATISFPLGQMTVAMKEAEAESAIADGCREFDYVLNVGKMKEHDYACIEEEMRRMTAVARKAGAGCKVILETCYLTEEEIIEASRIASRVKPDFIKTSTGFGTGGATPEHVALMKKYAGEDVQVKASGGIRTFRDALAMIEAGATRLGTSAGVKIIGEMKAAGLA